MFQRPPWEVLLQSKTSIEHMVRANGIFVNVRVFDLKGFELCALHAPNFFIFCFLRFKVAIIYALRTSLYQKENSCNYLSLTEVCLDLFLFCCFYLCEIFLFNVVLNIKRSY